MIVRVLSVDAVPEAAACFSDFLEPEEIRRAGAFRRPIDSDAYASAHALLRVTLTDLLGSVAGCRRPSAWRFFSQSHGKPELAAGQVAVDLRFNLSHTKGMVVAAFALGRDVGIDVEAVERNVSDDAGIAEAYFSSSERIYLNGFAEPAQRRRAFLELWTAKEAFIKAIGQGLSMPLDCFSVDLVQDCYQENYLPAEAQDRTWLLKRWQMPKHLLALAVGSAPGLADIRIDIGEVFWNPRERSFKIRQM